MATMRNLEQRIHRICDQYDECTPSSAGTQVQPDGITGKDVVREIACAILTFGFGVAIIVVVLAIFGKVGPL